MTEKSLSGGYMLTSCPDCGKQMRFTHDQEYTSYCSICSEKRNVLLKFNNSISQLQERITDMEREIDSITKRLDIIQDLDY